MEDEIKQVGTSFKTDIIQQKRSLRNETPQQQPNNF